MADTINAIRGMHDALPDDAPRWRRFERIVESVLERYGYREIRLPLVEKTELFERSIGETTDIVTKEMYSFVDRNGEGLTLRPEGTAGCVRAGIEHGLFRGGAQRLWYSGPMFRYERPQKARFRQFHQIGAEVFGLPGPDIDAELIALTARIWRDLGFKDLTLQLNSLGDLPARRRYREALVSYFSGHLDALDGDARDRLARNPLRILDSKDPKLRDLIEAAPAFDAFLDADSGRHFLRLREILDALGLPYVVNPRLVRGLDYYNRTVFEWTSAQLGAQGTVCAGGRYDTLVEHFGGDPVPAIGFAMGVERLLELLDGETVAEQGQDPHVYMVLADAAYLAQALCIAEKLRDELPKLRLMVHCGGGSFKSQFKRADKSGAAFALILGEEEVRSATVGIKALREETGQSRVPVTELAAELARRLALGNNGDGVNNF